VSTRFVDKVAQVLEKSWMTCLCRARPQPNLRLSPKGPRKTELNRRGLLHRSGSVRQNGSSGTRSRNKRRRLVLRRQSQEARPRTTTRGSSHRPAPSMSEVPSGLSFAPLAVAAGPVAWVVVTRAAPFVLRTSARRGDAATRATRLHGSSPLRAYAPVQRPGVTRLPRPRAFTAVRADAANRRHPPRRGQAVCLPYVATLTPTFGRLRRHRFGYLRGIVTR